MPKDVVFDESARRSLERGVNQLADAVTHYPWSQRSQRSTREAIRRTTNRERWCHHREGNRA